jgi:LysR family transcriptional regulator, transcriptional activator of nhaA
MNPWINYRHLLYFKIIAEEKSVSRAAQKLKLGQPTLSAQLRQFEDELGVKLFERHSKRLFLTEQGKIALEYAQNIFKMGNEMFEVLHDNLVPLRTHLRVGALDSVPKQVVAQLAKVAYKMGNCTISLIEGKADELIRELVSHRVDLYLANFLPPPGIDANLRHRSIFKSEVCILGAPKFKILRKGFPQSISKQRFVMPTMDSQLRHDLEHWGKNHSIFMDIIAETQDIALKKLMAIDGLGLIPAASKSVTRQVLSGDLIEIGKLKGVYDEVFLISSYRKVANPIANKLMDIFSI